MSKIEIETTQNIKIEYNLASIGDRIIATLIDLLILVGYVILVALIVAQFDFNIGIAAGIIIYLPVFIYDLLCELFLNGQSFGKKIRSIKVVKIDGSQPSFIGYFLRWILRPVDIWFTYGSVAIITILINGKGQRLGDLAANTTVIKTKTDTTLEDTIFTRIRENYEPRFSQVSALNDRDVGLVKEVLLQVSKINDPYVYDRLLSKAKEVVAKKMGITSDLRAITFLQIILKDYNHTMSREFSEASNMN